MEYICNSWWKGVFQLNGGGARLGEIGDPCVVMGYKKSAHFEGAIGVYANKYNNIEKSITYGNWMYTINQWTWRPILQFC